MTEAFVTVRHVATIALNEWMLEFYQSAELTADTPLEDVFNIPLVSELLIYPVIMRVTGMQEVPSLGRVKKFLCEYLIQNADHSFFPDDEEIDDDADVPALSDEDEIELPEEEDDEDALSASDLSEEEEDEAVEPEDEDDDEEVDALDEDAAY